ncbi:MAG: peroxidase [Rhizobiaceae bacterium]|nr:peroxidase [Rhizobiaceae bacterium]
MALLPSLPEISSLGDVFDRFPHGLAPLLEYANAVLRDDSELTIGERELIAAYVSGLNACSFCHDSHKIYAEAFGIEANVVEALLENIETAPVSERLKPIFRYVNKLNSLPPKLAAADAEAVMEAGWSEQTLFTAIQVSGLFNLFNRIVEGTGVNFDYNSNSEAHPASTKSADEMANSYRDFAVRLGLK